MPKSQLPDPLAGLQDPSVPRPAPVLSGTGRITDPQAEFLPPTVQAGYAPGGVDPQQEPPSRYSEWDPRSAPATYLLLGINVAVYLWMVLHGVSASSPTPDDLLRYGANNAVEVLDNGQWFRLLTATFVHIGFLHIASNMWCLWNLGLLGEPLVGPWGLVAVYVLTGVAGNLLSVAVNVFSANWDHVSLLAVSDVGAGASGAVFGITGLLIILLSNRRLPIPWAELKRLRTSVMRFAFINLLIGASTTLPGFDRFGRIDNSAHIGGFAAGLLMGPALLPRMTAGRERYLSRQKLVFCVAALMLSLFGYWIANLA
jgi:rhomboid protease GluP